MKFLEFHSINHEFLFFIFLFGSGLFSYSYLLLYGPGLDPTYQLNFIIMLVCLVFTLFILNDKRKVNARNVNLTSYTASRTKFSFVLLSIFMIIIAVEIRSLDDFLLIFGTTSSMYMIIIMLNIVDFLNMNDKLNS